MKKIDPFYKKDDIFQRQQDYYTQVLLRKAQSKIKSNNSKAPILNTNKQQLSINSQSKIQYGYPNDNKIETRINKNLYRSSTQAKNEYDEYAYSNNNSNNILIEQQYKIEANNSQNTFLPVTLAKNNFTFSSQIQQLNSQKDPYVQEALLQNNYLFQKLQKITFGIDQHESQIQLSSNAYILPHYKNQECKSQHRILGIQHKQIEELTKKILNNQRTINKMKNVRQCLEVRIKNIKELDSQIYKRLQDERVEQVELYLKTAKNALEQGDSVEKINLILRKILL